MRFNLKTSSDTAILVTGGAGFIGSNFIHLARRLFPDVWIINLDLLTYAGNMQNLAAFDSDPKYVFVKGDICDPQILADLFAAHPIQAVVNFAAETHVDRSIRNPGVFVRTNVLGTQSLLTACRNAWEKEDGWQEDVLYLQVSTDEVYGSLGETGLFSENNLISPHSPYAASKAGADLMVQAFHDTYDMPVCITRCSNNYGPYQFPEKLIPLMINNALQQQPLPVYGDGLNVRDWLYVEDHCHAILQVLEKGASGEVYNIGGNNEKKNIEIVHLLLDWLHEHVDPAIDRSLIKYVEDRKGHDRRYAIDASKIAAEVGWVPETDFDGGIVKTIRWYTENKQWLSHVISGEYMNYYREMYGE